MSLNPKIIAVIAVAAIACIAAGAFIVMNQESSPDIQGNWVKYDLSGEKDAGMESYTETGQVTMLYTFHSKSDKSYQIMNAGMTTRTYTEMGKTAQIPIIGFSWMQEKGSMEKGGTETISTAAGEKECTIYKDLVKLGDTWTYWIADDWIPYKIVREVGSAEQSGSFISSTTYAYISNGHEDIETDCKLVVAEGEGVKVSGNEGTYAIGSKVKLTAEYDEDKGFGGWYDRNNKLLGKDPTLEITITRDTEILALNGLGWDRELEPGVMIDLKDTFGVQADRFLIENNDMGTTEMSDGTYDFEGGSYTIYAYESDVPKKVYNVYVDGTVTRLFEWTYGGSHYQITMEIDYSDVTYAKDLYTPQQRSSDRPDHVRDRTFVTYSYTDEIMAPYMDGLVSKLIELYKMSYSEVDEYGYLDYILRFTQEIEYQADEEYTGYIEYWKFPLETLFDKGGDCEDTSILFAAIAHQSREILGFDTRVALVLMPQHASAGVIIKESTDYKKNPDGFIFGETTATGYDLGDIPGKVEDYFLDSKYYPNVSTTIEIV